jgi:hypothetical protein
MPVEVSSRHTGVMATVIAPGGDVDIAAVAALFADRTRAIAPTDGIPDTRRRSGDRLSSQLAEHPWVLGPAAGEVFAGLGVPPDRLAAARPSRRPLLRFCMDWSEQRHHLAGQLGADVLAALLNAGWVTRAQGQRSVQLTPAGRQSLSARLGLDL